MSKTPLSSPCIKVCAVDATSGWCIGCGRTIKEITSWVKIGEDGRAAVTAQLAERMETLRDRGKLGPVN